MNQPSDFRVIVAEPEASVRRLLADQLLSSGAEVLFASSGQDVADLLSDDIAIVILECDLPKLSGFDILEKCTRNYPEIVVLLTSSQAEGRLAERATELGAFDWCPKPFDKVQLSLSLRKAIEVACSRKDIRSIKKSIFSLNSNEVFIGSSDAVLSISRKLGDVAENHEPVYIHGEEGTGKSLLARLLHQRSPRRNGPFVLIDCQDIPRNRHVVELFGSSSAADGASFGKTELSMGGTLFIDNISDLCPSALKQLVTQLKSRSGYMGGNSLSSWSGKIIAASRLPLGEWFLRTSIAATLEEIFGDQILCIPPLRDRPTDIGSLTATTLNRLAREMDCGSFQIEREALSVLEKYNWPGNVRQLEQILENATLQCKAGLIETSILPSELQAPANPETGELQPALGGRSLRDLEKIAILQTLDLTSGNKSRAAQILGISEKSIYNKMKRHNLKL